jgi:hypothetical protein
MARCVHDGIEIMSDQRNSLKAGHVEFHRTARSWPKCRAYTAGHSTGTLVPKNGCHSGGRRGAALHAQNDDRAMCQTLCPR